MFIRFNWDVVKVFDFPTSRFAFSVIVMRKFLSVTVMHKFLLFAMHEKS